MKYPEYCYTEIVTGGVGKAPRDRIVKLSEVNQILSTTKRYECYRSHFRFTEDFYNYVKVESVKTHGKATVAGYDGMIYTDYLWIDIDSDKNKGHLSLAKAKDLLDRLMHLFSLSIDELLRCYFSGNKGFHIGIPAEVFNLRPSKTLNDDCLALAKEITGGGIADESLYEKCKLLRLSNTQHDDSKLYKIELTPDDILECSNMDDIKFLARQPRELDRQVYPDEYAGVLGELLSQIPIINKPEMAKKIETSIDSEANWVSNLLANGWGPGDRTPNLRRLIGYYRKIGMPQDICYNTLMAWDLQNDPPLQNDPGYPTDKIEKTVIDLYKYENLQTPKYDFFTWDMGHTAAPAYIADMDKTRIKFGYSEIDKNSGGLGPGEVCYIQAFTGVGKTAIAQSIQLNLLERQGVGSLLISLEMTNMRLYFRMVGMLNLLSPTEIEEAYRNNNIEYYLKAFTKHDYKKIVYTDPGPVSIKQIESIYQSCTTPVGLVIIDYIGLVREKGQSPYERMSNVSAAIVKFASDNKVAVLGLVQTNRTGKSGPMELGMARDSGLIDADARIILGLSRDEVNDPEKKFRKLQLLKATHGYAGADEDLMFLGNSARLVPTDRGRKK